MPHLVFVPFVGFRVKEDEMRSLGMSLPGLRQRARAIAQLPALGLLTLAGATPLSWTCSYVAATDCTGEVVEEIAAQKPTLVAVSALTASVEQAYPLCTQLRQRGIATVIGGLHATVCPDEASRDCDAVVIGSGEPVWHQVLADAQQGQLAKRYDARRIREFHWWSPRLDLLVEHPPRFTLQTQRGCPLACEFCGASRLLGQFREKPIHVIQSELDAITAISPRPLLELADDNTFAGDRDADALLDALDSSGARWFTEADWRIGERPDLLARLAEVGCRQVLVGIESIVFRYPGQGEKQAELNRIMAAVEAIQDAGVVVNGCFIVGADGETRESMQRLGDFILASPLAEAQITIQTPFPGTSLYRRLKRNGRLLPDRGWSHYTLFDVTYQPDLLNVEELEFGFRELLQQVYSAKATNRRTKLRRSIWAKNRSVRT